MSQGWYGVDLDGTLARYDGWNDGHIGDPIVPMLERVKGWLDDGKDVRIVTARVSSARKGLDLDEQRQLVEDWCLRHLGRILPVTAEKDMHMIVLWDDRAVTVEANTGRVRTFA